VPFKGQTIIEAQHSHTTSHLFTLRLWLEPLDDERSEWRGELKYTATGEIHYFRRWDQLKETLRLCLPGFELAPGSELQRPPEAM